MLVINLKAYENGVGSNLERFTNEILGLNKETKEKLVICPQTVDILRLKDKEIDLYAQHIDANSYGSHTGSNLANALKDAGIKGTLINHSEKRLSDRKIKERITKAKELDLTTIVCAQNPEECEKYSNFEPDYLAYEPPELIGGDISVSSANPDHIEKAVKKSGEIPTLTGAGIKTKEDVRKSIELGCDGVLVASGIVKSENPVKKIKNLCEPL